MSVGSHFGEEMNIERILSNPYRVMILKAIGKNGATFTEIRDKTGLSTGTIYHHLNVMRELIYREGRKYVLTRKGRKVLEIILSGDLKYEKPKYGLIDIFGLILLRGFFKKIYLNIYGEVLSILAIAWTCVMTYNFSVGFILLKPIRLSPPLSVISAIFSFFIISIIYFIIEWISIGTLYKLREILDILLIQIIPLSILNAITILTFILNINSNVLNSFIQFISTVYLASTSSSVSGMSFDRALALAGIILFLSQII